MDGTDRLDGGFDTMEICATRFVPGYFAHVEAVKITCMSGSRTTAAGFRTSGNAPDNLVITGGGADWRGGGDGHGSLTGGAESDRFIFGPTMNRFET